MVHSVADIVGGLWRGLDLPGSALDGLRLAGEEPALPSSFRVGAAASASIAASGLAAALIGTLRGLPEQTVSVDMRHAATEFHSERWLLLNGEPPGDMWDRIAGTYQCGDGRWVRLHTNFPHHREGVLRLLGCAYDRDAVAAALRGWEALRFEDAAAEAGLCVTAMRSFAEWDAHPQGIAVRAEPLIALERIGEAPVEGLGAAARPLAGVRVVDMTRVIAGPVAGRTMAAHGADVLLITAPHLHNPGLMDTSRGKRSAQLDLRDAADVERLRGVLRGADVFLQGYRPGALASRGFGPEAVAALRPGIVCVSLAAFGHTGPWRGRRGFDSLNQTAIGLNDAEGAAFGSPGRPKPLPVQALDHASGYFLMLGALAGLYRRATVGGSWHVRVSLARTGLWLRELGRLADGFSCDEPRREVVAGFMEESESGYGRLTAVRHAAGLSATPARWERAAERPGASAVGWGVRR